MIAVIQPIFTLPEELTTHIFSFMDPIALSRCADACSHFKAVVNDAALLKAHNICYFLPQDNSDIKRVGYRIATISKIAKRLNIALHPESDDIQNKLPPPADNFDYSALLGTLKNGGSLRELKFLIENFKTPYAEYRVFFSDIIYYIKQCDEQQNFLDPKVLQYLFDCVEGKISNANLSALNYSTGQLYYNNDGINQIRRSNLYTFLTTLTTITSLNNVEVNETILKILKGKGLRFSYNNFQQSLNGTNFSSGAVRELLWSGKRVESQDLRIIKQRFPKATRLKIEAAGFRAKTIATDTICTITSLAATISQAALPLFFHIGKIGLLIGINLLLLYACGAFLNLFITFLVMVISTPSLMSFWDASALFIFAANLLIYTGLEAYSIFYLSKAGMHLLFG